MLSNVIFDSYKRGPDPADADKRIYLTSKTVTNGAGALGPVSGELRAILGITIGSRAYFLYIENDDVKINDKVVVTSPSSIADDYYVKESEVQVIGLITYQKLLILKDD